MDETGTKQSIFNGIANKRRRVLDVLTTPQIQSLLDELGVSKSARKMGVTTQAFHYQMNKRNLVRKTVYIVKSK